jgi:hypothetical protein
MTRKILLTFTEEEYQKIEHLAREQNRPLANAARHLVLSNPLVTD